MEGQVLNSVGFGSTYAINERLASTSAWQSNTELPPKILWCPCTKRQPRKKTKRSYAKSTYVVREYIHKLQMSATYCIYVFYVPKHLRKHTIGHVTHATFYFYTANVLKHEHLSFSQKENKLSTSAMSTIIRSIVKNWQNRVPSQAR